MESTAIISEEHRLARTMLHCLDALAAEARSLDRLDGEAATSLLSLLERFLDWNHQDKEELHLFPHLMARATGEEAVRVERLFQEHVQERRRLIGMWLHLEGACRGEPDSVSRFVANALVYSRLMLEHLREEEAFLLPLADALLNAEDDRRIQLGFQRIDRRLGGIKGVRRKLLVLCRRLGMVMPEREDARRALVSP